MKWLKFKYILLLVILMAMVFTMACKTKTTGETKPKIYYTIDGEVKNPAGFTVPNARVEVAGYTMVDSGAAKPTDLFATLTDSDGAFSMEIIAYDNVAKVTLKISKDGSSTNYMNVGVVQGLKVTVSALLASAGGYQTVDVSQNATVTGTGGASVTINAGTLRNAAGAAPSTARVSVAAIDSTADRTLLPGSLYGLDGTTVKLFSTYGMIAIDVLDAENNPMTLASGATAAISIPVGDIVGANPSATVGLWYYNVERSSWLLEGMLTLNDTMTAYTGTISHFSLYNAGETWDMSFIKIRVVDQAGQGVVGAETTFFKEMFSNNGVWQESFTSGPEGYVPSILSNELAGIVPANMAGYIPLPANTQLNVRIKYIKASDAKKPVFLFPDKSPDPAGGEATIKYEFTVNGEPFTPPTPYTFTTAAAGEITPFEDVAFQLETSATVTMHVQFENGDPATGWMRFVAIPEGGLPSSGANYVTTTLGQINANGDVELVTGANFWSFVYTKDKNLKFPAKTNGIIYITTGAPAGGVEYLSWFVDGGGTLANFDDYAGDNGGPSIAKLYTSLDKGTISNMVVTLKGGGSTTGPVEAAHTYLAGTAKLANGNPAPVGSWVVFKGVSSGTPVVIRAKVGANGVFPDPSGPFSSTVTKINGKVTPIKVDSEGQLLAYIEPEWVPIRITVVTVGEDQQQNLEKLVGETWTLLEANATFYVDLIAGIKYTNTEIVDVTTDPLNPDVLFTYEYEAKGKDVYTTGVTFGPNTTVSGRVYYDEGEGGLGKDLLVTFTLKDAVTECVEDENDPDFDEDCEVDVPVTDITDGTGAYSVNLEIKRDYIVTVATHSGDTSLTTLKTVLYEGNATEDAANDEFDITIGAPYEPVATVTGTVVYEAKYGTNLYIKFTKVTPGATDEPVIAIAGDKGLYSADLEPATQYSVTVYQDIYGAVLYPSTTYPVTNNKLLFTSSDIDSYVDGEEDELNIQIGAGLVSFPYSPYLPAGSTGFGGILLDNTGKPVAKGTFLYLQLQGSSSYIWGIVNDADGTFYAASSSFVSTGEAIALTPGGVYSIGTTGRTINAAFTAGQKGELITVRLTDPGAGGTPSNIAYLSGTLLDNTGKAVPVGTFLYLQLQGSSSYIWGIVADADGNIFAAPSFVSTGKPIELTPGGVYSIGTTGRTINAAFTAGKAGQVQTVRLTDPGAGGTASTITYLTGYFTDSRTAGQHPVFVAGTNFAILDSTNTQAARPIVGDDKGKLYGSTQSGSTYTSTGKPVNLTAAAVYSLRYSGVVFISGYKAGQAGEVQTVLLTYTTALQ